jgi:hypothetical protein
MLDLGLEHPNGRQVEIAGDVDDGDALGRLGRQRQVGIRHGRESRWSDGRDERRSIRRHRYGPLTDTILLTVPAGLRGAGVIALVLGGLGSRLDLPVDRIDELALAAATVAPSVNGDALELEADVLDDRLVLRIGPLEEGMESDAALRRVVDALVDRVGGIRKGDEEWLELEIIRSETGR